MSKHAGRLKRKWRESTLREKGEKDKDGKREKEGGSVPLDRRNIRLRSQQLFQSTKQRVAGRVEKLSHAGLDISPQNGFFYIRPTSDYLVKCVTSPLITLIDFRNQAEYKEMHLRTAINIPSKYLNLPSFEEASLQIGEPGKEHTPVPSDDDVLAPFDLEPLISQAEMDSNHELFKNTWIDDILQYSLEKKVSHQFVVYCSAPRARRSLILPGVLHVLKSIYREQIEAGQLEIYVLKNGFEKMRTEKWLLPSLCASTDLFRRTPVYSAMEFTDDDVYTEVLPYLFLSSSIGATNAEQLQKNGITVVLNLTEKQIDYPAGDFATVHVCMADIRSQNTTDPIAQSNEIIEEARRNLGRVLVHCTRGQSRSPIIAIAYLMKSRSWALLKSFLFVREKRPWIGPNPSFMSQLMIYEDQLQLSPSSQFPLHAYTLLESRDEDFDENVRVLGLYYNYPQDLFELLEARDLKRAHLLIKEDATFRYTRRSSESDETPLHYALAGMIDAEDVDKEQLAELIKELTDARTINQDTLFGETPLIVAVRKENLFYTRYLLGENANVALINSSGKNALHYAAAHLNAGPVPGNPDILHELLKASKHQRQLVIEDIHGFTPLDYALFSPELFLMQTKFLEELVPEDEAPIEGSDFCLGEQLALFTMNVARTKLWQFVFNKWFSPKMQLENEEMFITADVFRQLCEKAFPDPDRMPTNQSNRTAWKLEKRGRSKVNLYGSAAEICPHTNAPIPEKNVLHFLIDSVKDQFPQGDPESLFGILNSLFSELPNDHREAVNMMEVLRESDDILSEVIHKGLPALTAEECTAIVDSVLENCQACLKAVPHLKVKGKDSR